MPAKKSIQIQEIANFTFFDPLSKSASQTAKFLPKMPIIGLNMSG